MTTTPTTPEEFREVLEARRRADDEAKARRAALAAVPDPPGAEPAEPADAESPDEDAPEPSDLARFLAAGGYRDGDRLALLTKPPGGAAQTTWGTPAELLGRDLPDDADTWLSVNAFPAGVTSRTSANVERVLAVVADLDVGGTGKHLPTWEAAHAVKDEVSALLHAQPAVVVFSGHGLQPRWRVDDGGDVARARALGRAFARLVAGVAQEHGGTVDTVSDAARVMRVPGTWNVGKGERMGVVLLDAAEPDEVDVLTLDDLEDRLTAAGVRIVGEDHEAEREVAVPPSEWREGLAEPCRYVARMIDSWATATPPGRHPWLVSQMIRAACARRLGCLNDDTWAEAQRALVARFGWLLEHAGERRAPAVGEVAGAADYAMRKASEKTEDEAAGELGNHLPHGPDPDDEAWVDELTAENTHASRLDPTEAPAERAGTDVALDGDKFTHDVAVAAHHLRVREAARELVARDRADEVVIPPGRTLDRLFDEPDDTLAWSVDHLLAADSKGLLSAQHKAGKTTLGANLVRSWVDGVPFLGTFPTAPLGNVVVLDNEMGARRLKRWYRPLGIGHTDRVDVIDLRGAASTFNILDKATRSRWAERLAGADGALVDCLRPFLDALGLDEHREIGRFLEALDELMAEAGVGTYVLTHHTGHDGEHARGDSRVLDWPDEIWNLRRAKPADPNAPEADGDVPRFFAAYGRESDLREGQILLGDDGRTLAFRADVTRASARADVVAGQLLTDVVSAAVQEVGAGEWFGIGQASAWVKKDPKTVRPVLDRGVRNGLLDTKPNPRGSGWVFSLVTGGRE